MLPFLTAMLVRNERSRYLREVLDWHGKFGPILVLDDGSTDGSYELARAHPAVVECERLAGEPAWGLEAPKRRLLWERAASLAEWVLYSDADQLLSADPRNLCASTACNAWAFRLYDLWGDRSHYREDKFWRGHHHPRPWLFAPHRVPRDYQPQWSERGIHSGHAPFNFPILAGEAPESHYWLHLGYVKAADREAKLACYRAVGGQLTEFEKAHAESIADKRPTLRVLPSAKPLKILVGSVVRKRAEVLRAFLESLLWQEKPQGRPLELSYAFVSDYPQEDVGEQLLKEFVKRAGGTVLVPKTRPPADDFSDASDVTHQWTKSAMARVGEHKNRLLQLTLEGGYDALWLLDSDLILDRTVLASLLACQRAVVSAVYWTRWHNDPKIHAGPQVWLRPPYVLDLGPHYPEHEFRKQLAEDRDLVRVAGLGACTLIQRSVIEKGVGFSRPPAFPTGGLWDGEDRYFCEWARRLHVDLWADAWPDIFHVYHPSDAARIAEESGRLGAEHPKFPNIGHLVSLRLTNLEDRVGPEFVRCRLGSGKLLPELEAAVLQMQRGDTKIVRLHFPSSYPTVPTNHGPFSLAGQNRLVECALLDCKPFALAPVIEEEFYASNEGSVVKDATQLTPEQHTVFAAGKAE